MHLRNQLNACGLQRILEKMEAFGYDLINRQLDRFRAQADNDYEEVLDMYNDQVLNDMADPQDVFQCILAGVEGTRSYDFFLSTLQHMLLIKDEGEIKYEEYLFGFACFV